MQVKIIVHVVEEEKVHEWWWLCHCIKWGSRSCWEKRCHHLMLWLWHRLYSYVSQPNKTLTRALSDRIWSINQLYIKGITLFLCYSNQHKACFMDIHSYPLPIWFCSFPWLIHAIVYVTIFKENKLTKLGLLGCLENILP